MEREILCWSKLSRKYNKVNLKIYSFWFEDSYISYSKNCDSPGRRTFFATPFRNSQGILLVPKKTVDPFIENETKTRIPRYSKLYKERDIGKELNWVDNFSVTFSKNNNNIHRTFKEFFDKPVNYRGAVTVGTSKGVSDIASSSKYILSFLILYHNLFISFD